MENEPELELEKLGLKIVLLSRSQNHKTAIFICIFIGFYI